MFILKVLKMSLKQRKIKSRIEEYLNTPYWTSIPYYSSLSIVVSAFPYDQSTETQAFEEKIPRSQEMGGICHLLFLQESVTHNEPTRDL